MESTLADRLVLARTEANLTQDDVARQIGMAQPSYSSLERGKSASTSKIGSLAHLYGVEALWLETGEGPMRRLGIREPQITDYLPQRLEGKTPDERRMLRGFRLLTERQRRGLLLLLDTGE